MSKDKIFAALSFIVLLAAFSHADQLPIEDIKRDKPVDFTTEIFPILKENCLACHHAKESEGGLNLESHEALVKGGDSGATVVAGDHAMSLLLSRAAGIEDDLMPPEDNSVGAKTLTPKQLGLIRLWIQQGAVAGSKTETATINWQPIPAAVKTIYALDVSADGKFVAAGHGNRVVLYDLASGTEVGRLADPSLESVSGPGVADVDLIQSVAIAPDGERIATGGYRSVRIWKKSHAPPTAGQSFLNSANGRIATNADGSKTAIVNAIGDIELWSTAGNSRLRTLRGHRESITGLVWAGASIVSSDAEGRVIIWNESDGQQLANKVVPYSIDSLAADDNASVIAALDSKHRIHVWKVTEDENKKRVFSAFSPDPIKNVGDANAIALSAKPEPLLIVGTSSSGVSMFKLSDGNPLRKVDHGSAVTTVAVSPDQVQLATAGQDGKTKLWNIADGKLIKEMAGTPKSRVLLAAAQRSASREAGAVKRLTAMTAVLEKAVTKEDEAVKKIVEARDKATVDLAEKEKSRVAAVAKVAATVAAIARANKSTADAKTKSDIASKAIADATMMIAALQKQITEQQVVREKFDKDAQAAEQQVAVAKKAEAEAQKKLDDARTQATKLQQEVAAKQAAIKNANDAINKAKQQAEQAKAASAAAVALIASSNKALETQKKAQADSEEKKKQSEAEVAKRKQALAAATQAQQRAKDAVPRHASLVASTTRRNERLQNRVKEIQQSQSDSSNACLDVVFSPDGRSIVTVHADRSARVYRVSDGLALDSHVADSRPAGAVVTNDGQICVFSRSDDASVWSLRPTWKLQRTIGSHQGDSVISDRVTALDFRSDGLSLAVGSGPASRSGDVKVFAVDTGEMLRDFTDVHSDSVLGLRFSPDGRSIASSAADKTVRLLDVTNQSVVRSFEGHTHHVLAVDWQDDGETLASASADQNVKVWNAGTGEQRKTIAGFGKEITAIAFVQQTNQIVTACADGQLRLHDTSNGKSIRSFNASGDFLYSLAITADGKSLIAGGQNGILRVWNVSDGKLLYEVK